MLLGRIIGSGCILAGSIGLGVYFSTRESTRIKELNELKKALTILSSEIEYMAAPLATACQHIATRVERTASALFGHFATALATSINMAPTASTHHIWAQSLNYVMEKSFLTAEDFSILDGFGKTLGYLDKTLQKNAIHYTTTYIDHTIGSLEEKSIKNKKMYRSLGVIGGLLITIILW